MNPDLPCAESLHTVVLRPGDFHFGGGHTRISTLLGSCVSITLWHPRRRIGGMCHYMMTERNRAPTAGLDARYATEAFELLLQHIAAADTKPAQYQAKLFGGADMFRNVPGTTGIGLRNVELGRRLLADNHIALIAEHVAGHGRRKLHFDLWNGNVWLSFPDGRGAEIRSLYGQ